MTNESCSPQPCNQQRISTAGLISSPRSPSSLQPVAHSRRRPAPTQANEADNMLCSARSFPPSSLRPDMTGGCTTALPLRCESRKHDIVRGGRFPNLFAQSTANQKHAASSILCRINQKTSWEEACYSSSERSPGR
ncbi:unnamed protein product [Ectocarpus sp. 12 AP-2014]